MPWYEIRARSFVDPIAPHRKSDEGVAFSPVDQILKMRDQFCVNLFGNSVSTNWLMVQQRYLCLNDIPFGEGLQHGESGIWDGSGITYRS